MRPGPPFSWNSSRAALVAGVGLLALGVLALVMPLALEDQPGWKGGAAAMLQASPYLFLAGFALLVLYVVRRPRPEPGAAANESVIFGKDTTEFGSRLDESTDDAPHG